MQRLDHVNHYSFKPKPVNMIRNILFAIFILQLLQIHAQTVFQKLPGDTEIPIGIENGISKFVDLNKDGFDDLIISGYTNRGYDPITALYMNDGNGNFRKASSSLDHFEASKFIVGDFDKDEDIDVVISGYNMLLEETKTFYFQNDGFGEFINMMDITSESVSSGDIKIIYANGDDLPDFLLSGEYNDSIFASIYINQGGSFIKDSLNLIPPLTESFFGVSDVDGDLDDDFIFCGREFDGSRVSNIWLNNGDGDFLIESENNIIGMHSGKMAFVDVDNDGDVDLFMNGKTGATSAQSKFYLNDGSGFFSNIFGHNIPNIEGGDFKFCDLNLDGYSDLVISGLYGNQTETRLLLNNGSLKFFELKITIPHLYKSTISVSDWDNDGDYDIYLGGDFITHSAGFLYKNNGDSTFSKIQENEFLPTYESVSLLTDIDNDQDLDYIQVGVNEFDKNLMYTYENNGSGQLTAKQSLNGLSLPALAAFDFDGDGFDDLMTSGFSSFKQFYKLQNRQNGEFERLTDTIFPKTWNGKIKYGDLDNDGDLDVVVSGATGTSSVGGAVTIVFENDGLGNFSESPFQPQVDQHVTHLEIIDINNDGHLDILHSSVSRIGYNLNNGDGSFAAYHRITYLKLPNGFMITGDIDGDDDLDILAGSGYEKMTLFKNVGDGVFEEDQSSQFPEGTIGNARSAFGDIDSDGDLDIVVLGSKFARIYHNNGQGEFTELENTGLSGIRDGALSLGDINGDSAPDLIISGITEYDQIVTNIYINRFKNIVTSTSASEISRLAQLFPNPISSEVHIKCVNPLGTKLEITNELGKSVLTRILDQEYTILNTQDLNSGVYFVNVSTLGKKEVYRLLKE